MAFGANDQQADIPAAEEIPRDEDVLVVPDLHTNASGAVASYFEWSQNLHHQSWEEQIDTATYRPNEPRAAGRAATPISERL